MSLATKAFTFMLLVSIAYAGDNNARAASGVSGCPGVYFAEVSSTGCCVGGTLPPVVLSTCAGWPVCSGPATTTTTSTPVSCAAIITQGPDWSSSISSASSSLDAHGTQYTTTLDGGAGVTTASAAGSSAGAAVTTAAQTEQSGTAAASAVASATSDGGAMGLSVAFGGLGGALLGLVALL